MSYAGNVINDVIRGKIEGLPFAVLGADLGDGKAARRLEIDADEGPDV